MPQPYRGTDAVWGVASIEHRPELAKHLGVIAAMWSAVETQMGHVLAAILHSDAEIGLTLFGAIRAESARLAMIQTIAQERLTAEEFADFEVLRKNIKKVGDSRDNLMHNLWGYAPSRPDSLMLFDSRLWAKYYAAFASAAHTGNDESFVRTRSMALADGIMEFKERDFADIADRIHQLYLDIYRFGQRLFPLSIGTESRPEESEG